MKGDKDMATTTFESDVDDDIGGPAMGQTAAPPNAAGQGLGETALASDEVAGDAPVAPVTGTEAGNGGEHAELENPVGAESGEEVLEASAEQLAAEAGAESAFSDLQGIEGFEIPTAAEFAESSTAMDLPEAGDALEGEGEAGDAEFAFLAGLIPALVSSVGPSIAKAVGRRLKPQTRRKVQAVGRTVATSAGAVAKVASSASGKKSQLLALISRLLEKAESAPEAESAPPVDPALVEAAAGTIEAIIGTDDRVRIQGTTNIPWRRICALRMTFPNGSYRGTGFLIGPRTVATAGHCVYLKSAGGWARSIEVIPGSNGPTRPFGTAVSTQFRSVAGWVNSSIPSSDYGCIVLPQGSFGGRNLGAFGFAAWSAPQLLALPAVVAGYPGDKPFAELWGMARRIKSVTPTQLRYDIDTMGGQSGAPVYIKRNGQRYCVGIHNYGGSTVNSATRITPSVYQRLHAWSKL
jgi:V8-like Glu-specific endopeptidase